MSRLSFMVLVAACGGRPMLAVPDAGHAPEDSGAPDAGTVAPPVDAGVSDAGRPDAGRGDAGQVVEPDAGGALDSDHDGISDADEERIAHDYLPQLAVHPSDRCPLSGVIYRLRPHPQDPTLVMILYDHLYETDCGAFGHTGDNETFAVTVNPARPAPMGVTAMKAISHQNTPCQKITTCGTCAGAAACDVGTLARPVVYSSKDKHGTYVEKNSCTVIAICSEECAMGDQHVPLINVGEPGFHLCEDLTDGGFITADAGWTKSELFHFNPWGPNEFGTAGKPSGDLVDSSFDPPACK